MPNIVYAKYNTFTVSPYLSRVVTAAFDQHLRSVPPLFKGCGRVGLVGRPNVDRAVPQSFTLKW